MLLRGLSLVFLLSFLSLGSPALSSSDPDGPAVQEEGIAVHRTGDAEERFHFRILSDSTLSVRQLATGGEIRLPYLAGKQIFGRLEQAFPDDEVGLRRMGWGYRQGNLHMDLRQRASLALLAGGGMVFLLLAMGLAWSGRRLYQERQCRLLAEAARKRRMEGEERERGRLARDLHDGPLQALHGLHMELVALSHSAAGERRLRALSQDAAAVMSELRAVSANLRPPGLEQFGLGAALRSHVAQFSRHHPSLRVEATIDPAEDLSGAWGTALFRIAQEALSNVAQHAEADQVRVVLRENQQRVILEVADDGRGIGSADRGQERCRPTQQLGLLGMRERAESMGMRFSLDSAPGRGTTVRVTCQPSEQEESRHWGPLLSILSS